MARVFRCCEGEAGPFYACTSRRDNADCHRFCLFPRRRPIAPLAIPTAELGAIIATLAPSVFRHIRHDGGGGAGNQLRGQRRTLVSAHSMEAADRNALQGTGYHCDDTSDSSTTNAFYAARARIGAIYEVAPNSRRIGRSSFFDYIAYRTTGRSNVRRVRTPLVINTMLWAPIEVRRL